MKLDGDTADWLFEATAWWLGELGPLDEANLALPIEEHFSSRDPEAILDAALALAGFDDAWGFVLVDESDVVMADPAPHAPRPLSAPTVLKLEDPHVEPGEGRPIPYTAEEAKDPLALVASIASGISHYLLAEAEAEDAEADDGEARDDDEEIDDDPERHAMVDLGAVMLGFGVFSASVAFRFQSFDDGAMIGWRTSRRGALGEAELGYALALFVELSGADERAALQHLPANPKAAFKWARDQLRGPRATDVARLRAIRPQLNDGPYR